MDDRSPPPQDGTRSGPAPRRREVAWWSVDVALLAVAAVWLAYHFHRLVLDDGPMRAVDLRLRVREIAAWFDGLPVYGTMSDAVYPPASYVLLWPVLGWLEIPAARAAWALLHVGVLALLSWITLRIGRGRTRAERAMLVLLPLSLYATGATIGNGQVGLVVVLALLGALRLVASPARSGARDVAAAALLLLALVKPSMGAALVPIVLFAPGGWRPASLTVLAYGALTWAASIPQRGGPIDLLLDWRHRAEVGSVYGATRGAGAIRESAEGVVEVTHVNVHSLLAAVGRLDLAFGATIVVLVALTAWVARSSWKGRSGGDGAPVWVQAGVCALVARAATYHGWYDDVLLLLPLLALHRLARGADGAGPARARAAAVLFALLLVFSVAPGGTYALPHPWSAAYVMTQAAVCLGVLVFLVAAAGGRRRAAAPVGPER